MKKLLAILLCVMLPLGGVQASAMDEDGIVSLMAELNIMVGDDDGSLRLDDAVSRAEFTKMVMNASEYKNNIAFNQMTSTFSDVPYTHWAAPYVRLAVTKGVVTGYPDATFRPENTVLFEEAVSICVRLLGYTEEDYGSSWPSGQISLAENLGLTEDVASSAGEALTRRGAMYLIYNTLNTNSKNSTTPYLSKINYELLEDTVLIATAQEDLSVGSDKVYTSAGTYTISSAFRYEDVGKKGTLIVKNGSEVAGFIPSEQRIQSYNIYQVLNDSVMVMADGVLTTLDAGTDLSVYYKTQKSTLSALSGTISTGDVLTTYQSADGTYDYGMLTTGNLSGPQTVRTDTWLAATGMDETAVIMRNGSRVSADAVQLNDIIYYSKALNTIWAYNKKVTGVYESASPNKDTPTSVTVSGITYSIEGSGAYNALSSNGSCRYGDTVTLLLGKDGQVADVLQQSENSTAAVLYGYLIDSGTKTYTGTDGNSYDSYYITMVDASGTELEYPISFSYSDYKNSVIKVVIQSGEVTVSTAKNNQSLSGKIDASANMLGDVPLAEDVAILDVVTGDAVYASAYTSVYPQRLDGVQLSRDSILYAGKNSSGEISELILKDVTGDCYSYGIVTSVTGAGSNYTYRYDVGGTASSVTGKYSVYSGQGVKLLRNGNSVDKMIALTRLDASVSAVTQTALTADDTSYLLSPSVAVYQRVSSSSYMQLSLSEVIENTDSYNITAYYDKAERSGGRIRVLIVTEKS